MKSESFILWFENVSIEDVEYVGGKNAALGEMYSKLNPLGINIPNGFAVTAYAYRYFLKNAGLEEKIKQTLKGLNTKNIPELQKRGALVRKFILNAELPKDLEEAIGEAYGKLEKTYGKNVDVAVRSSATAEDLPGASFAGQQETYLNISKRVNVTNAVKKCFASLFTNRAISYRENKGFSQTEIALSVGIQKMVRSDLASSGVAFTLDTETGFNKVVVINSVYGLGEMIVQGKVIPDEWVVFKPALKDKKKAIIAKNFGDKKVKMVYLGNGTKEVDVPIKQRNQWALKEEEVLELANWCVKVEEHFSEKHKQYQPMDIEWAKDGKTNKLYIVQARPETVHGGERKSVQREYRLEGKGENIVTGIAVGTKIAQGKVRVIKSAKNINTFKQGEVLVTEITDPDWEPIMKIATAIVTDKGGRTSHAAIVSRELGIPCVVGTVNATKVLKNGEMVTVDCSSGNKGKVLKGKVSYEVVERKLDQIPETKTKVLVNIGAPDEAFKHHALPVKGVGLGRLEFIISSHIKIHPNALIDFDKNKKDPKKKVVMKEIESLTKGYKNKRDYYVDELAEGIAKIGASFHPHEVIIRYSDFKSNEYKTLIGGEWYEPVEENPMIGLRGASRYYDPSFKEAFKLECLALKRVREEMGLKNVIPMVPFCRTVEEGESVIEIMKECGLDRTKDETLKVYVMCEIPSNVLMAGEFLEIFDGMSIGSNDLTQLTLGLDRDSGVVSHVANENHEAVKKLIQITIEKCREKGKYVGICGQAPSDYPEFVKFLIKNNIESVSLNPDTVIKTLMEIHAEEQRKNSL